MRAEPGIWSQGAVAEPRKEVKGLLANGVSQLDVPLCLCANKQDEMSPPANLGGVARPVSAVEGECGVLVGTHGTV